MDSSFISPLSMYEDAMRCPDFEGDVYVAIPFPPELRLIQRAEIGSSPKQDHFVCFFPALVMLGAVATTSVAGVSTPPRFHERKDWVTSVRLLVACVMAHDTQTTPLEKNPSTSTRAKAVVSVPLPSQPGRVWRWRRAKSGAGKGFERRSK